MEVNNGTIDSSTDMVDFSFHGFSTSDIFADSLFIIQPRSLSTTISVNPNIYDCLTQILNKKYGLPEDKGKHGHIYRCFINDDDVMQRVSITCYSSTHTLSVQGKLHYIWSSTHLHQIEDEIRALDTNTSDHPSATCLHQATSTPVSTCSPVQLLVANLSSCHPVTLFANEFITTSTQTHSQPCDASTQTNHGTSTTAVATMTCPEEEQTVTHTAVMDIATSPTTTTSHEEPTTCVTQAPEPVVIVQTPTATSHDEHTQAQEPAVIDVVTIPTSNSFSMLQAEDLPHLDSNSDDDLPPIPLPWKVSKSTRARKCRKSSDSTCKSPPPPCESPAKVPTECSTSEADLTSPSTSSSSPQPKQNRTVLIIGDSVPKHLVGKRLSRRLKVINRCLPGTDLQFWIKLAPVIIEEAKPSCVIIHCGTNNIQNCFPEECLDLLKELTNAITRTSSDINIAISSLTAQFNGFGRAAWLKEYNARLSDTCKELNWTYIDNSNIGIEHIAHLDPYRLHLNGRGIKTLAMNFISFLRTMRMDILNT